MSLRSWLFLGLLLGASCDSLFGSFSRANPKNCVRNPDACGSDETCDLVAERCISVSPEPELFAPLGLSHSFAAQYALTGNFDGNSLPDAVFVGSGQALVLYNPGSGLASQKIISINTTSQPFHALVSRVDSDALDDLVIVTERGDTTGTFGTIEFCAARGPDMAQPFACLPPQDLRFIPKAVLITDLIDDSTPELATIDDAGEVKVCRVLSISGMEGSCQKILPAANSEPPRYAELALLDDSNGDGRQDLGVLIQPMAAGPKLRILRTNSGSTPTISGAADIPLTAPELVAGNFNHSGKISLAAVGGVAGGSIAALPFYDLTSAVPVASTMVTAQPGSLYGPPEAARATAAGQFDGVGTSLPDDIVFQSSEGSLGLFIGSPSGLRALIPPGSVTAVPATHLLAAPFSTHVGGRYDLLTYSDPQKSGFALLSLMRSAGQSPRGLFTRTALTSSVGTSTTTPDWLVLSGKFASATARELALIPRGGTNAFLFTHDGSAVVSRPAAEPPLSLPDAVESAIVLPCADGQDALAFAFRNDKRTLIHRQTPSANDQQLLTSTATLLQVQAADVNADGLSDLLVLRSDGKVQVAFAQSRTCTLAPLSDLISSTIPLPRQFAVGDLNADGSADVVVLGDGGGIRVFRNKGDGGGVELVAETNLPLELSRGQMAIGEARRKGPAEILISMTPLAGNSQLYALALGADGRSLTTTKTAVNTLVRGPTLVLRDLNQDGLADALMLDPETGILSVTSWAVDPVGRTRPYYLGIHPSGLATGAIDGDSLPDLAVIIQQGKELPATLGLSVAYGLSSSELK